MRWAESVIFLYWVGPVPYLELFGAGPVEKNTLYIWMAFAMVTNVTCGALGIETDWAEKVRPDKFSTVIIAI